jgi:K+-sensing histidine kinase KdpD
MFLPFARLDNRIRHDGFGLGLALVSSISSVHRGTVHATAPTSGGLDITVRLPRRYDPQPEGCARAETT